MHTEEHLISWSAQVAIALYELALAGRVLSARWTLSRSLWTAGCAVYLLHVLCAFAFIHHWSHAAAYLATARQSEQVIGLAWGGGLYVNYAFTLLWLADVSWWWLNPQRYLVRSRAIECAVQVFMGFIVFNATVIFASGLSRWLGVAGCLLLALCFYRRRRLAARDMLLQNSRE
jgi:hypothetical protein